MTKPVKRKLLLALMIVLPVCVAASCLLYPPEIEYNSYLVPVIDASDPAYGMDTELNAATYDLGNSTIMVRYMTDAELNELFPNESNQGYYSINPYTYGNWVNPDLGYTPKRFTVFEVTIINRTFAKVQLDPVESIMMTDLGESYHSYATSIAAAKYGNSFENYYKGIRGQSGNEHYRYEMRLGMVRGKNYGLEEMIFRGDTYSGLISFEPLRPRVSKVRLVLNDIVYRFDAFDRPADMQTVTFDFERKIDRREITREEKLAMLESQQVEITSDGPEQLVNARPNDSARSAYAVNQAFEAQRTAISECFITRYRAGELNPGTMTVSFTIEVDGIVSSDNVISVEGIENEDFMNCVLDVIRKFTFQPIEDQPLTGDNIVKGPAKPVNVIYPMAFAVATAAK